MRLLIENGVQQYVEPLLEMTRDHEWVNRMAATKVLRSNAGHKPFLATVEDRFIPVLVARLYDNHEIQDCQYQAARALGNIQHRWQEAANALGQTLNKNVTDRVRRACVDALREIGKPEIKQHLLVALKDRDAEIRVQAARALVSVLGPQQALKFITEQLLSAEQPEPDYLNALRLIDCTGAAGVLATELLHPDPNHAARASQALARLGGEAAIRTLQAQQRKALDKYTEMLHQADEQAMDQFERLIGQARLAFRLSMLMHGTIFGVGVGLLVASLYVALAQGFGTFERYVGVGTAVGSLGTILLLFYRDPIKNIGTSVARLVKINVVFLGYVRQINQVDATFKQLFLASTGFGLKEMKETVEQIQDSVRTTLKEIKAYLGAE